jgi:hypothetical protein
MPVGSMIPQYANNIDNFVPFVLFVVRTNAFASPLT